MAVFDQYGLFPMALTTDATQDGPAPLIASRMIGRLPVGNYPAHGGELSVLECRSALVCYCRTTLLVQSEPVQAVPLGGGDIGHTHVLDRIRSVPDDAGGRRVISPTDRWPH